MNKARRKELSRAINMLYEAINIIGSVKMEEEEAYDNLPESFQYGEKGETMQEYIDTMNEAYNDIEVYITQLEEVADAQ